MLQVRHDRFVHEAEMKCLEIGGVKGEGVTFAIRLHLHGDQAPIDVEDAYIDGVLRVLGKRTRAARV